jgi:hypothetical protein
MDKNQNTKVFNSINNAINKVNSETITKRLNLKQINKLGLKVPKECESGAFKFDKNEFKKDLTFEPSLITTLINKAVSDEKTKAIYEHELKRKVHNSISGAITKKLKE